MTQDAVHTRSTTAGPPTQRRRRLDRAVSLPAQKWSLFSQLQHVISSEPEPIPEQSPPPSPPSDLSSSTQWSFSRLQQNVLKCAIAYLIASLFTLVPALSAFLSITEGGPSPSGHMVATVVVYFNPAKTIGAMIEADIYVLFGLAFSSFVSLGSMAMFWYFEVQPGWEWLADALVLSWIAGAMIAVAWLKLWMARPSFNTACSMICIIIFVVIVKEGGLQTLLQVSFIVLIGALISNLTCLLLWTESATSNLQSDMSAALSAFSTLLSTLTRTFLLDPAFLPNPSKLQAAIDAHQKSFTSLKRNLAEAHSEWLGTCAGTKKGRAYDDAVDALNRLAQHLGGLRGGTTLQADLAKAVREGRMNLGDRRRRTDSLGLTTASATAAPTATPSDEAEATLAAIAAMFGDLVDDLGPPMSALSTTCTRTLDRLRTSFDAKAEPFEPYEFVRLAEEVERALFVFDSTSNHAVMRLYRRSEMTDDVGEGVAVAEDGGISDNETVFLVYFFIFTIQEFARELVLLVEAMARIYALETRETVWQRVVRHLRCIGRRTRTPAHEERSASPVEAKPGLRRHLSRLGPPSTHPTSKHTFPRVKPHAPNTMLTPARSSLTTRGRLNQSLWAFLTRIREPDIKYAIKTGLACALLASPAFLTYTTRQWFLEYRGEWALLSFFVVISPMSGQTNITSVQRVLGTLLGASTAVAVFVCFERWPAGLAVCGFVFSVPCFWAILRFPTYAAGTRLVLLTYNLTCLYSFNMRNDDGRSSVLVVGFRRATAVTIGVVWAFLVSQFWWPTEARRELGKALSEFCFNIGWLYGRLVVNYSSPPEALLRLPAPGTPVKAKAKAKSRRRTLSPVPPREEGEEDEQNGDGHGENGTTPGVVDERTPLLLGVSGRGRSVSDGRVRTGMATPSLTPAPMPMPTSRRRSSVHLPRQASDVLVQSIHDFMAMELHLQRQLIALQELLAVTQHEPRLKGPFPVQLYRSILTSLQNVLDKLHSMRCVTTRQEWYTTVRRDFIVPVTKERRELVGNVILYFSVLASAFRLKAPLPPYLPPAEKSRQELVNAIRRLEVVKLRRVKGSRQLLYFAYALMMKGVIQELDFLGRTLQEAFGVLGGSRESFENLFRAEAIGAEEMAPGAGAGAGPML